MVFRVSLELLLLWKATSIKGVIATPSCPPLPFGDRWAAARDSRKQITLTSSMHLSYNTLYNTHPPSSFPLLFSLHLSCHWPLPLSPSCVPCGPAVLAVWKECCFHTSFTPLLQLRKKILSLSSFKLTTPISDVTWKLRWVLVSFYIFELLDPTYLPYSAVFSRPNVTA